MGIDLTSFEAIMLSLKHVPIDGNALTLARQGVHFNKTTLEYLSKKYNRQISDAVLTSYCETLFKELGFRNTESIDCSPYESATIIHDMNHPCSDNLKNKYDYIYDGGTIEHIFNITQAVDNISEILKVGGIFCSVTVNNNFSGHGIYQFSPEFFMSAFSERYGMKILDIYLAEVNSVYENWINVKSFNENNGGRNMSKFNTITPVYIITIAQKISDNRLSLIKSAPQQYSYEQIDWKK